MDRKGQLLSSLKKQVLQLKTHLDHIQKQKRTNRHHHRSISQSSRFNTSTFDSSYLDKGIKKFPLQNQCKNIIQVINKKSAIQKPPSMSPFRIAEYMKTKQNFSNQKNNFESDRKLSPNPLTGAGYAEKRKGKKTVFPQKQPPKPSKQQTQRRHFISYFY